jgi:hypothetical protein
MARWLLPNNWSERRLAVFYVLVAIGSARGLWNGQSNALVVGLILLGAADLARGRFWPSAFYLAGAVWVKLTPLTVALLFSALWPRRLGLKLLFALAVLAVIPFFSRPPSVVLGHYREWFNHLAQTGSERWPGFRDAWTMWLVVRHLFEGRIGSVYLLDPVEGVNYRVVQLTAAAGTLVFCLLQQRAGRPRRQLILWTLASGCAWLMLFGPAVEHATFVFLAPVLAWATLDQEGEPSTRPLALAAGILVLFFGFGSVARLFGESIPLTLTALPAGTALFYVWLILNRGSGKKDVCVPNKLLCDCDKPRHAA